MIALIDFVLAHLPPRPARVLEVGCGEGELARGLAASGYDVMGIDPMAPDDNLFRRIKLEELEEDARFDAVVASRSFHHLTNLEDNLARVAAMLGSGPLILDEFAWDQFDAQTADWYEGQRRVLVAAGRAPSGPEASVWEDHHHGVHGGDRLRSALHERFEEGVFECVPYLWRYLDGESSAALEESLIAADAIRAVGFRFVGIPADRAALNS